MPKVSLYLIRHAECEINLKSVEIIGGRSSDSLVTPRGIEQSVMLENYLYRHKIIFDRIYCSTSIRARKTAEIANTHKKDIVLRSDLEEMSQGDWEGKVRRECYTPEVMKFVMSNPLDFKAPNGESKRDVAMRAYTAIGEIIDEGKSDKDESVGIFTHGFTIKCFLWAVMNFDPALIYSIHIANCSITHIICNNDYNNFWEIGGINIQTA